MSALGNHPESQKRPQRYWLVVSVVLVLGLGAYVWLNFVLGDPRAAALLTVCTVVVVGLPLVLSSRLQLAHAHRDRALAQTRATEWRMAHLLRNREFRLEKHVLRREQKLQKEIADLRAREMMLRDQAHHDGLTGLANRILLADRFHFSVERAKRGGTSFALLMIDLDDFKAVNDNYGHTAGDAVLVTMARRLMGAVRASDTVARLGGDEFVLIIESFEDSQEIVYIGQKLIDTLSNSITLASGVVVTVGASVGLALYPDDGADMNDLLFVADQAMYECKSSGMMELHSSAR